MAGRPWPMRFQGQAASIGRHVGAYTTGMQLTIPESRIEELRRIVEAEFGEPVTYDEARVMAHTMLELYELVCGSIAKSA